MLRGKFPKTKSHKRNPTYSIFRGTSRALRNQLSASSYQPTIVRLRRCCLQLLNLVGSCVHAVPILWGNNRTLVLILSRGRCRRERFTAENAECVERKYKPPTQIECCELGDRRGRLSYRLWRDFYYRGGSRTAPTTLGTLDSPFPHISFLVGLSNHYFTCTFTIETFLFQYGMVIAVRADDSQPGRVFHTEVFNFPG